MSNKMKGVLKGLRYISQIFEDEEEPEMQIGFPTDVKHVAHIGWDGPAANAPSWIQKFKEGEPGAPSNGDQQNAVRDSTLPGQERRCSTGSDPILKSPSRRRSDKVKGDARRHSSATAPSSTDFPKRRSTSEARTKNNSNPPGPEESPSRDSTSSAKSSSRRRKTKTGSKSKPVSTTPDIVVYSDPGPASPQDLCLSSENDLISLDDNNGRRIRAM